MNTDTIISKLLAGDWLWLLHKPGVGRFLVGYEYIADKTNGMLWRGVFSPAALVNLNTGDGLLKEMFRMNSRVLILPEIIVMWQGSSKALVATLDLLLGGRYSRHGGRHGEQGAIIILALLAGSTHEQLKHRPVLRKWIESHMEVVAL